MTCLEFPTIWNYFLVAPKNIVHLCLFFLSDGEEGLDDFTECLSKFTKFNSFRSLATLSYASDIYSGSSIVSRYLKFIHFTQIIVFSTFDTFQYTIMIACKCVLLFMFNCNRGFKRECQIIKHFYSFFTA